jgi:UDP-glucose:tetrahydrobiopterin glucosyltransferase
LSNSLRLLLLSTPVGPLGSGLGGGVELTVINLAQVLTARGHRVAIAAPAGSTLSNHFLSDRSTETNEHPIEIIQVPGKWQVSAQSQSRCQSRSAPVVTGSALSNAWDYARQSQSQYDLLVNFAYDWLPFYLTPFLTTPVAHFVSMGSLSDAVDEAIARLGSRYPGTLGAYTRSQADSFIQPADPVNSQDPSPALQWKILGSAIDLRQYEYCPSPGPDNGLVWVGRISPEKGLEDAIASATLARQPLKIFGKLEDLDYWSRIQTLIAQAPISIDYGGFLPTAELQKALGRARALLVTPHWLEAFGIVAIEALACGVPVIAYRRGGLAEIVRSGETGWLVDAGDVGALVSAIARIDHIDRRQCRQQAEALYSLTVWGDRCEQWFYQIVSGMIIS